jgi:hypothetical protein
MLLSQFLFDKRQWGTPYSCAALTIFQLLSAALSLPDADAPLVRYGGVMRDVFTSRFLTLTDRPGAELRDAARRAWERAYASTLPHAVLREVTHSTPWRH